MAEGSAFVPTYSKAWSPDSRGDADLSLRNLDEFLQQPTNLEGQPNLQNWNMSPGCTLVDTGLTSVAASGYHTNTWASGDVLNNDRFGFYDTTDNRIEVPNEFGDGHVYTLGLRLQWASNNTGYRVGEINVNGTYVRVIHEECTVSGVHAAYGQTRQVLNAGEYVNYRSWHNGSASLDMEVELSCDLYEVISS